MTRCAPQGPCSTCTPPHVSLAPTNTRHRSARLDRLDRRALTSQLDVARLQKRKYEIKDRARAVLRPLTERAAGLARDVEHTGLQAHHVVSHAKQRFEAAVDERLARDASVLVPDLTNLQPPRL